MKYLSTGRDIISSAIEILKQGFRIGIFGGPSQSGLEKVDASVGWQQSGNHADAGGIANGGLAVSVQECRAATREPIKVRGLGLRMTAVDADPVVQVINGDEKDV